MMISMTKLSNPPAPSTPQWSSSTRTIHVGLLDQYPVTLRGMQSIYDAAPGIHVIAASTTPELIDVTSVDVMVIDAYINSDRPRLDIIERLGRETKVIVSTHRWTPELTECINAGARAYIEKHSPPEKFVDVVRLVAADRPVPEDPAPDHGSRLSPREHSVLAHISRGLTHDQTARRLGISRHTVDTYVKRARAKMKLGNKAELTRSMLVADMRGADL